MRKKKRTFKSILAVVLSVAMILGAVPLPEFTMVARAETENQGELEYTHLTVRDATCTEVGIKQECYLRSDGKYFTDETGETELDESAVIEPMIPHACEHHEADENHIEYWQCTECNKCFSGADCTTEISEVQTLIAESLVGDVADQTYTGGEIQPEIQVAIGSLSLTEGMDYECSYTDNLSPGTATVRVTFLGAYASLGYVERMFTIERATPDVISAPTASAITYGQILASSSIGDGEVKSVYNEPLEGSWRWMDDTIAPSVADSGTTEYSVIFTPDDSTNYCSKTVKITLTVNPKSVTITNLHVEDKTYDGTTSATISDTGLVDGKIGDDDVRVSNGSASFVDANAGDEKTVTFSGFSLTGSDAGNYTLSAQPEDCTASIGKAPLTVMANDKTKVYLDNDPVLTYTVSGLVGTDTVANTMTGALTRIQGECVSPEGYQINQGNLSAGDNYDIEFIPATLMIMSRTIANPTIILSSDKFTYNGSVQVPTVTAVKDGDTTIPADCYTVRYSNANATNVGIYTVYVDMAGDCMASGSKNFSIDTATVTIPTAVTGLKWTGSEQTGVAAGTGYTVANGSATNAGDYTATVTLNSTMNYRWSDGTVAAKEIPWSIEKVDFYEAEEIPNITKYIPGDRTDSYTIALLELPTGAKYYFTKTDENSVIASLPEEGTENTLCFTTNGGKTAGTTATITVESKDAPNYNDYSFTVSVIVSEYTVSYDWPEQTNIYLIGNDWAFCDRDEVERPYHDNELVWEEAGITLDTEKITVSGGTPTNVVYKVNNTVLNAGENTLVLDPGVHRISITGDGLDDWVEFKVIKLIENDPNFEFTVSQTPARFAAPEEAEELGLRTSPGDGLIAECRPEMQAKYNGTDVSDSATLWYRSDGFDYDDQELYNNDAYRTPGYGITGYSTTFWVRNGLTGNLTLHNIINGSATLDGVSRIDTICGQLVWHHEGETFKQKLDLDGNAVSSGVEGGYVYYVGVDCPDFYLKNGKVHYKDKTGEHLETENMTYTDGQDIFYAGGETILQYDGFIGYGDLAFEVDDTKPVPLCENIKAIGNRMGKECHCPKDTDGNCTECLSQNGDTITVCGDTFEMGSYFVVGENFIFTGGRAIYNIVPTDSNYFIGGYFSTTIDGSIIKFFDYEIDAGSRPILKIDISLVPGPISTDKSHVYLPCAFARYETAPYCYVIARSNFPVDVRRSVVNIEGPFEFKAGEDVDIQITTSSYKYPEDKGTYRGSTGDLRFFLDNVYLRSMTYDPSRSYECGLGTLPEGTYKFRVVLNGDKGYRDATATVTIRVVRDDSEVTLTGTSHSGKEIEDGGTLEYDPEGIFVIGAAASRIPTEEELQSGVDMSDLAINVADWKWQISNTSDEDVVEIEQLEGETTNLNHEQLYLKTVGLGTVTLKAGFRGDDEHKSSIGAITFTVIPMDVATPVIELADQDPILYDGEEKEPEVNVYYAEGKLIPADQYDVTYENNINATNVDNKAKIIVKSKDGALYDFDDLELEFEILGGVTIASGIEHGTVALSGTRTSFKAGETVDLVITPDTGYAIDTVSYNDGSENVITPDEGAYSFEMPASDVTVTAVFTPIDYEIGKSTLENCTVTLVVGDNGDASTAHYQNTVGIVITPSDGYVIQTVSYNDGSNHVITPDANGYHFTMPATDVTLTVTFQRDIGIEMNIEMEDVVLYTGSAVTPEVRVVDHKNDDAELIQGTDYTVSYSDNVGSPTEVDNGSVTVTGIGSYTGTIISYFSISPFNIADCTIGGTLEAYDDGNYGVIGALESNVNVWSGETKLQCGMDYFLYLDEVDEYVVGETYSATVIGVNEWVGTKSFTFTVIDLHHTVVFQAGEGSGSMTGGTIANDGAYQGRYDLPPCTFTAPTGKVFDYWLVSCEDGEKKHPGDYFSAPYIFSAADAQTITVTAMWKNVYTISALTRLKSANTSVGDVSIGNTPPFTHGDSIVLTAPDKSSEGYQFLGWFEADAADFTESNRKASTLRYEFVLEKNTNVVAVYEPRGSVDVKISVINGAKYTVDGSDAVQLGNTVTKPLGSILTLHAQEAKKVLQWQNANGKVLGTGADLAITVTGATEITLVYNTVEQNQSYLQFVSDAGQVLYYEQITSSAKISFPAPPSKAGYDFERWVIGNTEVEATEENILAEVVARKSLITVKPSYIKDDTTFTVTVNYQNAEKELIGEKTREYKGISIGNNQTFTAPDIDEYKFQCWKNGDQILGYDKSYVMKVMGNVTLEACYVAEDVEVEAMPTITLCKPYCTVSGNVHKITCIVTRDVTTDYTLVEHGVLYARNIDGLNESNFVIDSTNTEIKRYQSPDKHPKGTLVANIKTEGEGDSWKDVMVSFRGYMILKNKATGNEIRIYTDIEEGSYNTLNP